MHILNKNSFLVMVAGLFLVPGWNCESCAQRPSLFQRRDARMTNMFNDVKARRPGDLLVISINEQSDVKNRDRRVLQKSNSSNTEAGANITAAGDLGSAAGNLGLDQDTSAARNFDGNTQFESQRAYIDRFTVQVVDTLPNGNLLVSGRRNMSLEGDSRTLVLSGIVRNVDVTPNNSVSSSLVSDLTIQYESNGDEPERRFINQGWFGRKLNKGWPH